jgi:hypothetical protein
MTVMSRAYREHLERQYPCLNLYREDSDARQELQGQEQAWLEDQAAQQEWQSWLDVLEEQR